MERSVMGVDAFDNEITTQQVTTNEKVHILSDGRGESGFLTQHTFAFSSEMGERASRQCRVWPRI